MLGFSGRLVQIPTSQIVVPIRSMQVDDLHASHLAQKYASKRSLYFRASSHPASPQNVTTGSQEPQIGE